MRKSIVFIALIGAILMVACNKQKKIEISVIPKPVLVKQTEGTFEIDKNTVIVFPKMNGAFEPADFLAKRINFSSGLGIKTSDETTASGKNTITLSILRNTSIGEEGYELIVDKKSVKLTANTPKGLFNGVSTIIQLLPSAVYANSVVEDIDFEIPCCTIRDFPRFKWRGMHLDVSRHFFPVSFIKKYIDLMAMHKMNVFHWHLTDDNGWRIEIKKYPLLTEVSAWRVDREDQPWRQVTPPEPGEKGTYGGFYTQKQIKDVIAYAAKRNITVIPEIEMPGHTSEVFAAYPGLSCRGEKLYVQPGSYWPNEDIFCAGKEETFEFLQNVLDEVIALFPSEYIHIGGDEANKTRWEACPLCQKRIRQEGLEDEDELQSYFIKRIEAYLKTKSKKVIGWDEILEGGLAPEATVMSWRGFEGGIEAVKQGHEVIMCPTSHCYFDYYQADPEFEPDAIGGFTTLRKVYSFNPVPEELTGPEAIYVMGGQGNVWTEYIPTPEHAEYMAIPRMSALAEALWTPVKKKEWDDFRQRLETQFDRLEYMNVNYSKGSWKVTIRPVKTSDGKFRISLETEQLNPAVYYTLNGSEPTTASKKYEEPFMVESSITIKAGIFVDGELKEKLSEKKVVLHKAVGGKATLTEPPSERYAGEGAISLIDGLKGSNNFRDGYWIGFHGEEISLQIDLGSVQVVNTVTADFIQQVRSWIFMPRSVHFRLMSESRRPVAHITVNAQTTTEAIGTVIEPITADFKGKTARYIYIDTRSFKVCPDWHEGAGEDAWIFVDEVIVN
ncbi:MAG: family 20 glycosylhydrolase [Bacteroidales bacterium]|nr:family 20 glycosylhydrolase [Bacteroidales bacterium]